MTTRRWVQFLPFAFLFFLSQTTSIAADVYIDDEYGDAVTGLKPTYSPSGAWTQGNTCSQSTCFSSIDYTELNQLHNGTYHYANADSNTRSVTMKFNGTSFSAFCVLANNASFGSGTHLTFILDSQPAGTFDHNVNSNSGNEFNYQVYSNSSMSDEEHTFQMLVNAEDGIIFFDYAQYTPSEKTTASSSNAAASTTASTADSSTSNSSNNHLGAILGAVLGTIGGAGVIIALIWFWRRRRQNQAGGIYDGEAQYGGPKPTTPSLPAPDMSYSNINNPNGASSAPLLVEPFPVRDSTYAASTSDSQQDNRSRSQSQSTGAATASTFQRRFIANPSMVPEGITNPSERAAWLEQQRERLLSEKARLMQQSDVQAASHANVSHAQTSSTSSNPNLSLGAGGSNAALDTDARIAALAAEVERLRAEREMERAMQEAPPQYEG